MQRGGFYFVSDQYFIDFPDPYLKGNKGESRPTYYCFLDKRTQLHWMIPLSSQPNKIALADRKFREGKKDLFHHTNVNGRPGVMLIGDMFPVVPRYVVGPYVWNSVALVYKDTTEIAAIEAKARKVLALLRRGVRFSPTQPDVLCIEAQLLDSFKKGK